MSVFQSFKWSISLISSQHLPEVRASAREQARYIYKKTETGQTLNVDTMKLEIGARKTVRLNGW